MATFWKSLPKPFFVLAPMEDVTDTVFRRIVADCARPDVFFTEFMSVDGMYSPGRDRVMQRLIFTNSERPLVAQIWGLIPENFYKAAKEIVALGFDGIDINMGCPERNVLKKGACSGLIKNRSLASEIIKATQEGAGEVPVSVKTRIGLTQIQTNDWIPFLLEHNLDALTVHGRTAKELSLVSAHWDEIGKAVKLRDQFAKNTLLIGNGDVKDHADGLNKVKEFGVDGVMIGRGIFHNLWAFNKTGTSRLPVKDMFGLMLKHCHLYDETWGDTKSFLILRKFFKIYVQGFEGASQLRDKIMKTKSTSEVEVVVADFLSTCTA